LAVFDQLGQGRDQWGEGSRVGVVVGVGCAPDAGRPARVGDRIVAAGGPAHGLSDFRKVDNDTLLGAMVASR
jgi:hypothetical protein